MTSRKLLLTIILLLAALWAGAQDITAERCVRRTTGTWGTPCEQCQVYDGFRRDHSGTFRIELENICSEPIDLKVAMEERTGTWRTFPQRTLMPGEHLEAFACQGTGRYLYWARRTDDPEIRMPTDAEILTEYRGR